MVLPFQVREESNSSFAIPGHTIKIGDFQERAHLRSIIESPFATQVPASLTVLAKGSGCSCQCPVQQSAAWMEMKGFAAHRNAALEVRREEKGVRNESRAT